jgi:hypothetical protein
MMIERITMCVVAGRFSVDACLAKFGGRRSGKCGDLIELIFFSCSFLWTTRDRAACRVRRLWWWTWATGRGAVRLRQDLAAPPTLPTASSRSRHSTRGRAGGTNAPRSLSTPEPQSAGAGGGGMRGHDRLVHSASPRFSPPPYSGAGSAAGGFFFLKIWQGTFIN